MKKKLLHSMFSTAFDSDAYILVVKCNDAQEIQDVVAFKYAATGAAVADYEALVTLAD